VFRLNIWNEGQALRLGARLVDGRHFSASNSAALKDNVWGFDGFGFCPRQAMTKVEFHSPVDAALMAANEPPDGPRRDDGDGESKTGIVTKTRPKTKKPNLYKVLLLNDDFTPMEFVVLVLQRFFNKGQEDATRIMLHVHHKGVGICGVYTYEVAETKVTQVMDFSRQHGHPLQCTMEKE
jgi:ATP-dependent Clp protease adaptor protein ClpS